MIIQSKKLKKCDVCNKLYGFVIEKNNGKIPVICSCSPSSDFSSSIFSIGNDKFSWSRGSKYKDDNGVLRYKQRNS